MKTPSVKQSIRWPLTCTSSLPARNPLVRAARSRLLMLPFFDFPFLTASETHEFNNPGCSRKCILERNPFLKKNQGEDKRAIQENCAAEESKQEAGVLFHISSPRLDPRGVPGTVLVLIHVPGPRGNQASHAKDGGCHTGAKTPPLAQSSRSEISREFMCVHHY